MRRVSQLTQFIHATLQLPLSTSFVTSNTYICAACIVATTICPYPPAREDLNTINSYTELSAWRSLSMLVMQVFVFQYVATGHHTPSANQV